MSSILYCSCGEIIVKALESDTKIRSKIIIFRDNQAYAICKGCNRENFIPVKLDTEMVKSLSKTKSVPLYLKKTLKSS